jgi:heat shock protein HtpX
LEWISTKAGEPVPGGFTVIKRIVLFFAVNLLVVVTISTLLNLFGVRPYLTAYGIDYKSLMIFCLAWGMGGAFISLGISRMMAKWMMGVKVIDPSSAQGVEAELVQTVHRLSRDAGLPALPEVGIYESPEVNAFATGPTKARALVAVSTGLLHSMDRNQVEGVLGHEVAHVANGDMVTMTLIQGVVNAFVMFLARVIAYVIADRMKMKNGWGRHGLVMGLEIVFSLLGFMVVAYFSRLREFRADAGGARLAGREKMISSLEALRRFSQRLDPSHPSLATLKISGARPRFFALFSTHPPLDLRIARLQQGF